MSEWKPVRKIAAAGVATLAAEGAPLYLFLAGAIGWREFVAMSVALLAPGAAGYLIRSRPSDDEIPGGEVQVP